MIFYVPGLTGMIWCILSYFLIHSYPRDHPRISLEELELLESGSSTMSSGEKLKVPWMKMIKSKEVHALWFTHFSLGFGLLLVTQNFSLFIREALAFKVISVR